MKIYSLPLAAALALFPSAAHAFRLDPMVVSVPLTEKPMASATYTVENNTGAKIAVEFSVAKRVLDEKGKEERPPAEGFQIYPEQLSLESGQKRAVRVTWSADRLPGQELPFRFVASQLPVEFADGSEKRDRAVNIKFLVEYVASLYLTPAGVKPKMKVVRHQVSKDGKLEVLVANEGTKHLLLEHLELSAKAGGKTFKPSAEALAELRTENLLPGNTRWLRVALPKGFPAEKLEVSVDFHP